MVDIVCESLKNMKKLEEIKINNKGIAKLKGKELSNFFPIGNVHCFSDDWETTWEKEMYKKIPKNAKYFTSKIETKYYGQEGNSYEVAYVQFYGGKGKIENLPGKKKKSKQIPKAIEKNVKDLDNVDYKENKVYVKRHGVWQWRESQHGYIDGDNTWD